MKMEIRAVLLVLSITLSWEAVAFAPFASNLHSNPHHEILGGARSRLITCGQEMFNGPTAAASDSLLFRGDRRRRSNASSRNLPHPAYRSSSSPTKLNLAMSAPAMATLAGAISGGFFAGGLHAIAGPDHLAALLPRCSGQRWYRAGPVGALWGMGHGIAATILGVSAFALKATFSNSSKNSFMRTFLSSASHLTEIALGLSLIIIGVLGIREAREWEEEISGVSMPQSLSAAASDTVGAKSSSAKSAVILNGLLHGFSWDGAPSLAPSLAVATWSGNIAFLSAYAAGTMAAMAIVTTLVGEGTRKAGQFFQRPDIPQKFSLFSSVLAIVIGAIWLGFAFV